MKIQTNIFQKINSNFQKPLFYQQPSTSSDNRAFKSKRRTKRIFKMFQTWFFSIQQFHYMHFSLKYMDKYWNFSLLTYKTFFSNNSSTIFLTRTSWESATTNSHTNGWKCSMPLVAPKDETKYFYSSLLLAIIHKSWAKRMKKKMLKIVSSASSVNDFNPFYQKPFQDSAHRLTENHEWKKLCVCMQVRS